MRRIIILVLSLSLFCFVCPMTAYAPAEDANIPLEEIIVENRVYEDYDAEEDAYFPIVEMIIAFALSAGVTAFALVITHNKANKQISATNYVVKNGYKVENRKVHYIRTYETVQRNFYASSKK